MRVKERRLRIRVRSARALLQKLGTKVKSVTCSNVPGEVQARLEVTDLYNRIMDNLNAADFLLKARTPEPRKKRT